MRYPAPYKRMGSICAQTRRAAMPGKANAEAKGVCRNPYTKEKEKALQETGQNWTQVKNNGKGCPQCGNKCGHRWTAPSPCMHPNFAWVCPDCRDVYAFNQSRWCKFGSMCCVHGQFFYSNKTNFCRAITQPPKTCHLNPA